MDWIGLLIYCCIRQWNGKCMERAPRPRDVVLLSWSLYCTEFEGDAAGYEKRRRYFSGQATRIGIR